MLTSHYCRKTLHASKAIVQTCLALQERRAHLLFRDAGTGEPLLASSSAAGRTLRAREGDWRGGIPAQCGSPGCGGLSTGA